MIRSRSAPDAPQVAASQSVPQISFSATSSALSNKARPSWHRHGANKHQESCTQILRDLLLVKHQLVGQLCGCKAGIMSGSVKGLRFARPLIPSSFGPYPQPLGELPLKRGPFSGIGLVLFQWHPAGPSITGNGADRLVQVCSFPSELKLIQQDVHFGKHES